MEWLSEESYPRVIGQFRINLSDHSLKSICLHLQSFRVGMRFGVPSHAIVCSAIELSSPKIRYYGVFG